MSKVKGEVTLVQYTSLKKYLGDIVEGKLPYEIRVLRGNELLRVITDEKEIREFDLKEFINGINDRS